MGTFRQGKFIQSTVTSLIDGKRGSRRQTRVMFMVVVVVVIMLMMFGVRALENRSHPHPCAWLSPNPRGGVVWVPWHLGLHALTSCPSSFLSFANMFIVSFSLPPPTEGGPLASGVGASGTPFFVVLFCCHCRHSTWCWCCRRRHFTWHCVACRGAPLFLFLCRLLFLSSLPPPVQTDGVPSTCGVGARGTPFLVIACSRTRLPSSLLVVVDTGGREGPRPLHSPEAVGQVVCGSQFS